MDFRFGISMPRSIQIKKKNSMVTNRPTDQPTDRPTNRPTDPSKFTQHQCARLETHFFFESCAADSSTGIEESAIMPAAKMPPTETSLRRSNIGRSRCGRKKEKAAPLAVNVEVDPNREHIHHANRQRRQRRRRRRRQQQ